MPNTNASYIDTTSPGTGGRCVSDTASILEEAAIVRKDRAARVDDPEGNFARIARIWEVVFGHPVTTKQVSLAMIGLKLARECYKPWRDNLVDLAGYADCAAEIEGYYAKPCEAPDARGHQPRVRPRDELPNAEVKAAVGRAWGTHDSGP